MRTGLGIFKKACNVLGVASMLLGLIPTPVLSQIGTAYAESSFEQPQTFGVDITFRPYSELLGPLTETQRDDSAMVEYVSFLHTDGDWIGRVITTPVKMSEECEGDECIPEEDPADPPQDEGQEDPSEEDAAEDEAEDGETVEGEEEQLPGEEAQEPVEGEEETDQCPQDENKEEPGICGCGIPDADTDGDGVLDCEDVCPEDALNACVPIPDEDESALCEDGMRTGRGSAD